MQAINTWLTPYKVMHQYHANCPRTPQQPHLDVEVVPDTDIIKGELVAHFPDWVNAAAHDRRLELLLADLDAHKALELWGMWDAECVRCQARSSAYLCTLISQG